MKQFLDRIIPFFPLAGLILIVAGGVWFIINRRFDLAANLLFGVGALLLLLFAVLRPDDVRRLFSRRQTRYGLTTLLSILFFIAIGVLIYWIAFQNPDWRFDTTAEGAFTPLPETVELLENLDEPLHVIGFYTPANFQREQAETTLESLQAINDQITYEFQDPESNPLLAQQYDLNFDGTLVFIRNQDQPDEVFSKANSTNDNDLHAALIQVINPVDKKAYFLTGHGELDITGFGPEGMGTIITVLEEQGFEIAELNLFTAGSVPADATVVALVGQNGPLDAAEVAAVSDYLDQGGAFFLARDPVNNQGFINEDDGIAAWLQAACGFTIRQDVIIDQDLAQAGQALGLSFIGDSYGNHPIITEDIRTFNTRFVLAQSIDPGAGTPGRTVTELVRTSANSWGETNIELLGTEGVIAPDPEDAPGPLAVGVACEDTSGDLRVVAFGDSDFIRNDTVTLGGNSLLFTNAMNWLANDEITINLAPRETVNRQVNIPQTQLTILQLTSFCLGPLVLGIIGVVVYVSRRRRR